MSAASTSCIRRVSRNGYSVVVMACHISSRASPYARERRLAVKIRFGEQATDVAAAGSGGRPELGGDVAHVQIDTLTHKSIVFELVEARRAGVE